jgi:hypothetical protein
MFYIRILLFLYVFFIYSYRMDWISWCMKTNYLSKGAQPSTEELSVLNVPHTVNVIYDNRGHWYDIVFVINTHFLLNVT